MNTDEALPVPSHTGNEFLLWLWWVSEEANGYYNFKNEQDSEEVSMDELGSIDIWVDERIAMRNPSETKITAVITGQNPSQAPESKVALSNGKVIEELRLGMRTDDREFFFTLKGPTVALCGTKLPVVVTEGGDEVIFERLALLEELDGIIGLLFKDFAIARVSNEWAATSEAIATWLK